MADEAKQEEKKLSPFEVLHLLRDRAQNAGVDLKAWALLDQAISLRVISDILRAIAIKQGAIEEEK